jgi:hypothetical protein
MMDFVVMGETIKLTNAQYDRVMARIRKARYKANPFIGRNPYGHKRQAR